MNHAKSPLPAENNREPLYALVARTLKDEIVSGVYPIGSKLPTEDVLADRFSISRHTVREALRGLREDGLVASRKKAGTVVLSPQSTDSEIHNVMSINDLANYAAGTRFDIETMGIVKLDVKLAAQIGIPADTEWLEVRGFRHSDEVAPLCWTDYYINRDFAAIGRLLPRHNGPIFPLIEDMFGQTVVEVQQHIAATLISKRLALSLGVKEGTAALEVRRVYKTADNKVAQATINTHPASRFQHSMTMRRVKP